MVGAVKPKLGHCHLRKLFDRKESSAPIKLFLQLLSFKKVSCLFIPLFPLIYQLGAFVFLHETRISLDPFGKFHQVRSSSLIKLSILLFDESPRYVHIVIVTVKDLKFFEIKYSSMKEDFKELLETKLARSLAPSFRKKYARRWKEQRVPEWFAR